MHGHRRTGVASPAHGVGEDLDAALRQSEPSAGNLGDLDTGVEQVKGQVLVQVSRQRVGERILAPHACRIQPVPALFAASPGKLPAFPLVMLPIRFPLPPTPDRPGLAFPDEPRQVGRRDDNVQRPDS